MTVLTLWTATPDSPTTRALRTAPWRDAASVNLTEDPANADAILAVFDVAPNAGDLEQLTSVAAGRPLLAIGAAVTSPEAHELHSLLGLAFAKASSPAHDVRLRRGSILDPRQEGDVHVRASWARVDKVADDVDVLATANVAFSDHAVITWRGSTRTGVITLAGGDSLWRDRDILRTIQRWARYARGLAERPPVRVGLLAYGAIGHEHLSACMAVPGLELAAVCDRSQARLDAAGSAAPDVLLTTDGEEMLARDDIDLVIVSTPPDTHAMWAMRAVEAGKHVVLEKPMALTSADCDAVLDRASTAGRTALVYQNRRWDSDYLTLKRAIEQGRLGEVFHTETFVGGFGHPCNYWHSDALISGGAIFDWGSHFIDQVLQLTDATVESVTAANHKRRWFDVTNADHSRVTVRFDNGTEAEFIHSDLAAALKPKYYVLGTEGAIVGNWRHERLISRTGIGTMAEERFAPADAPADLTLVSSEGDCTLLSPVNPRTHGFHRELADQLVAGLPLSVRPEQSRNVVAVMEAAELSASQGSRPVAPL